MSEGVKQLNENKVGAPFVYSDACFMGMALFCNTIGIPYRQLAGNCKRQSWRKEYSKLFCHLQENQQAKSKRSNGKTWFSDGKTKIEIVFLAGDSTGLKPTSKGWTGLVKNRTYDVDSSRCTSWWNAKTKKIYAISVADDKSGDAPEFEKLLSDALYNIENSQNVKKSKELLVGCDGVI